MFHRIGCSYYLRARYYNTGIGRFTQEDVIYNDGLNLYAYCSSNPVMYEDPSGYAANRLLTYSYNGYEFVLYCRKLPDIRKSSYFRWGYYQVNMHQIQEV